ncbi:MAG: RecQ family ATP-dependent DNA helicase [Bacteroidetes bacterium]|nr:RecQ family ATP-dependent DNA helicase [Bacteroidota bacterium]
MTINQILLRYWGYSSFRPLQEEIIQSVLDGRDTLALLPTGGGKSITFQVPAMAMEGICLVVTPLISLMQDQVENLKKKGIPAAAIHSGMYPAEIETVLNNCRYGDIKLLYLSPERLTNATLRDALKRMKVNLIAVDESHCVSQWGYDFRPPYLRIAEIREVLPAAPILALTATATPDVISDIQDKLHFRAPCVFRKSFERTNITYFVFKEEDKRRRILNIIKKVKGAGIIYVRNRRQTREIAEYLTRQGIPAIGYHAGMDPKEREKNQKAWMKETRQVIVATNAFGMGIDKPNVRFVIHLDLPDSIEAYFQEAGRAGRDEKPAFAVLLYEQADILEARKNLASSYPELQKIRDIYQALCNYLKIPYGNGKDYFAEFDLGDFSESYNFAPVIAFNALKFLEKEGFLLLSEAVHTPSRIFIKTDKESLYRFQVENVFFDPFIKTLLRSYSGIFSDFSPIREEEVAKRTGLTTDKVIEMLMKLSKLQVIDYIPRTDNPRIVFTENRVESKDLHISPEYYKDRLDSAQQRIEAMIRYAESTHKCRSQLLLAYFGESTTRRCGKCDVCIQRNKIELTDLEFNSILKEIKPLLNTKPCSLEELVSVTTTVSEDKVIRAVQWLLDNEKIEMNRERLYFWKNI